MNAEGKINILFIATSHCYFDKNHASFNRMYNNLKYFHDKEKFNVFVLQPLIFYNKINLNLKKNIKVFFYKEFSLFKRHIVPLTDINPFYIKKVHEIIQNYKIDLIHCDFLFGLNSLRIFNVPISYNAHNIESEYARKIGFYSWKKIPKILRFLYIKFIYYLEKFGVKLASNINAISQEERRELIEIFGLNEDKVIVSGLGYKKDIYNKQISKTEARKNLKIPKNKFIIIFHGSYNVNFANKETIDLIKDYIAPRIKDDSILFLIAGSMPRFEDQRNVKFLGFIKELTDFLYCADIAIAPILRGTGINTKMIDYLSGRVPIISTEKAVEGLIFQHEVHGFIVSNIMTDTIKYIYYLKGNPKILQVIKNNITNLVESKYNWGKILKKVEKRYLRLSEI